MSKKKKKTGSECKIPSCLNLSREPRMSPAEVRWRDGRDGRDGGDGGDSSSEAQRDQISAAIKLTP